MSGTHLEEAPRPDQTGMEEWEQDDELKEDDGSSDGLREE
jgi:hypothetical protein